MCRYMEANATSHCDNEDQDEYVLLDLDGVSDLLDIPPNANYVLTVTSQFAARDFIFFIVFIKLTSFVNFQYWSIDIFL